MGFKKMADLLRGRQTMKHYDQGSVLPNGMVYLGFFPRTCFDVIPWRSREIFEVFIDESGNEKNAAASEYVHVAVSLEEWQKRETLEDSDEDDEVRPKRIYVKKTIEYQRKRLLLFLRRLLGILRAREVRAKSKVEREEKQRQINQRRVEKQSDALKITRLKRPAPIQEDPLIDTYVYDLEIQIHGSVEIQTLDNGHSHVLKTGKYCARRFKHDVAGVWIVIQVGRIEYGLSIGQWLYLERNDSGKASVKIIGLD